MMRIILALAFSVGSAAAQPVCMSTADMLSGLEAGYGEHPIGIGLSGDKLVQVIVNYQTGTWTMLASTPDGQSCILATGTDWAKQAPKPNL